jgi:uncharacterized membrane protein
MWNSTQLNATNITTVTLSSDIAMDILIFSFLFRGECVNLGSLGMQATMGLLYQPQMIVMMMMIIIIMMTDERGADAITTNDRREKSTRRNPIRVLLRPHHISHDLTQEKHPDHRSGTPVTNCAIYDTAYMLILDLP